MLRPLAVAATALLIAAIGGLAVGGWAMLQRERVAAREDGARRTESLRDSIRLTLALTPPAPVSDAGASVPVWAFDSRLRPAGRLASRPFDALPPLVDEAARWALDGGVDRRSAELLGLASEDDAARLLALVSAARNGRADAATLSQAAVPASLHGTREWSLVRALLAPTDPLDRAVQAVGSRDDAPAAAILVGSRPEGADALRARRAELAEAETASRALRTAAVVRDGSRVALRPDGSAVVARRRGTGHQVWTIDADAVLRTAQDVAEGAGVETTAAVAATPPHARLVPRLAVARTAPASLRHLRIGVVAGLSVVGLAGAAALTVLLRSARRADELADLRSEFVATVSHELRTPVAVVRTAVEALQNERITDGDARRDLVSVVDRASQRLAHLVGGVLTFARMERGVVAEPSEIHDLVAVLREAATAVAAAEGTHVDVRTENVREPVRCDREAVRAALGNLLTNAARYAGQPADPPHVAVRRDRDLVVVEVVDHGPGVPVGEREAVFERFRRGSTAGLASGTGIGLALVRHVARLHGGDVSLRDTPGGGATFSLRLRSAAASAGTVAEERS